MRTRIAAAALLATALLVRLAAVYVHPIGYTLYSDMANYVRYSDLLLAGDWQPILFFQPVGYPFIIATIKRLFANWRTALGLYQVVLSTATVALVWHAARKSFGDLVGWLAFVVATFHISWIALSTVALPETTFTFLLAALLCVTLTLLERRSANWAAVWGLVFIATFVVKASHGFFGPMFLLGTLMWQRWSGEAIRRIAIPVSLVVGTGLLLHGAMTYRTTGRFQMVSSEGGLNFVEGHCPSKVNIDSEGAAWGSPLYVQLGRRELKEWDFPFTDSGYFMKQGLRCIADNPMGLVMSLESVPFLFVGNTLWPAVAFSTKEYTKIYDLFFGLWLIVGLVIGLRALLPLRAETYPTFIAWLLPFAALSLCVYVFKSEIRFRVPFDVWLIPTAVSGWVTIFNGRFSRTDGSRRDCP
jgi:hypothetical protein